MYAKILIGVILFLSVIASTYGASSWTYAQVFPGPTAPNQARGSAVATDSSANRWVGGSQDGGQLVFGSFTLTATNRDLFVVKQTSSNTFPFATQFTCVTGADNAEITGIAADSSNNAWVYGWFIGTLSVNASTSLTSPSLNSAFLVKLTSSGSVLFAKQSTSNNHVAVGRNPAIDASGNVYITGSYNGMLSFDSLSAPVSTYNNIYLYKFSSAGVAIAKQVTTGTSSHYAIGQAIDFDSSGNIYVGGRNSGTVVLGSTTIVSPSANLLLAKLDSSLAWVSAVQGVLTGSSTFAEINDIHIDGSNRVFVTGRFQAIGGSLTLGSTSLTTVSSFDTFVGQASTSLVFASAAQTFCSDGKGFSFTEDTSGSVWLSGTIKGPSCSFSGTAAPSTPYNQYLVKVSPTCVFSGLTTTTSSNGSADSSVIAFDGVNKIIMTGSSKKKVNFGSKSVNSATPTAFIAVYSL